MMSQDTYDRDRRANGKKSREKLTAGNAAGQEERKNQTRLQEKSKVAVQAPKEDYEQRIVHVSRALQT